MHKRVTWRVAGNRRLDQPRRSLAVGPHYDPDAFGRVPEGIARYFGTARYVVIQTVLVIIWIGINVLWATGSLDPYPFILLNLAFSTQAAYAAPLILLAQAERDRIQYEQDPQTTARCSPTPTPGARARRRAPRLLGRIEAAIARSDDEVQAVS